MHYLPMGAVRRLCKGLGHKKTIHAPAFLKTFLTRTQKWALYLQGPFIGLDTMFCGRKASYNELL